MKECKHDWVSITLTQHGANNEAEFKGCSKCGIFRILIEKNSGSWSDYRRLQVQIKGEDVE